MLVLSSYQHIANKALALLAKLAPLKNVEALADAVLDTIRPLGFETLFISAAPRPKQRLSEATLLKRVPYEWLALYEANRFEEVDPIFRQIKRSWKPFDWNELSWQSISDPRAAEVMRKRREFGINKGLVVPIFDSGGFVSAAGSRPELSAEAKGIFHLLAIYAFHYARSLRAGQPKGNSVLSEREREVLSWVAAGKSAWEIGEILHIAKRTVDEHVLNACRKLGAVNRTQAVALAIRDGLIAP